MVPNSLTDSGSHRPRFLHAVTTLFLGCIFAATSSVVFAQNIRSADANSPAESLTSALHALNTRHRLAHPAEEAEVLDKLLTVAATRHQLLTVLMEENPGEVLRATLPAGARATLPPAVQHYIEEEVDVEGVLEVFHEDRAKGSRYLHFLKVKEERFSLHFAGDPPALQTGSRVRVRGARVDSALALASGSVSALSAALPNTFGPQPTAVILVNFQDNPTNQPYTLAYAQGVVFSTTSNFYRENSFQQTWLTGDVYGWYTIPLNSTTCDPSSLATYAQQAATAAGVNLSAYTRYVYAFPNNACTWWGLGTVGGHPSMAWINGSFQLPVVGHEMGHNFGLYHSHALECGTSTLGTSCTAVEYGDTLDIMGSSSGDFNAYQKEWLGWLNYGASPPITTIQTDGAYALDPYETAGPNPKALKILKSSSAKTWYYVEYRQAIGYDNSLSSNTNVLNGVVVHTGSESSANTSYLLDMTPSTSSWWDPALGLGQTFYDPESGVRITPAWANSTGSGVNVSVGTITCVRAGPTVALSPSQSQSVQAGTTVTYTASVMNNDTAGCTPSSLALQATVPTGWSRAFGASTLTLSPGAGATTTLQVTSAVSATAGSYTIGATATSSVTTTSAASATAMYLVTTGGATGSITDTFDRPDSTTLGNGWVEVRGDLMVSGNALKNAALSGDHMAVQPGLSAPTQDVAADFASADNNTAPRFGVVLRYQNPQNYYLIYRVVGGTSQLRISRIVNGVEKILASPSTPNPTRDAFFRLRGRAEGTTLTLELNGVMRASVSDTTFSTGTVGILLGSKSAKSHRADNFTAAAH